MRNFAIMRLRLGRALLATGLAALGCSWAAPGHAEETESAQAEAQYIKLSPDFIVNLNGADGSKLLMVTIQGMTRQVEGVEATLHHMAGIRHHLLMLLSEQSPDSLKTVEDKQRLMNEALEHVQQFLIGETGKPGLDAVYFTDFVVE